MKCLIVANGKPPLTDVLKKNISEAALIIAADGAARLFDVKNPPHILIGDFDSADLELVKRFSDRGVKLVSLACEKNETDTQAALDYAIENKATEITILGATGMRFDHTLANVAMLLRAHNANVKCRIIDEYNEMVLVEDEYELLGDIGQTISIIPYGDSVVVNATNLKYPLNNLKLSNDSSRGISNIISQSPVKIFVSGGYALIIKILAKP